VFADLAAEGNYVVAVSRVNYTFSLASQAFNNLSADTDFDFTGQLVSYNLSGSVTESGTGLSGVTINLRGSQTGSTTTDANGNYSFTVLAEGNYTLTPSKQNYTFSPANTSFSNLGANQTAANFTATLNRHVISGRVTDINGISLPNATMTLSGSQSGTTTTNSQGIYAFTNLPAGGNYTITPSLSGSTFTPSNRSFNALSASQVGDFSSAPVIVGRANVALESNGAVATASSTLDLGRLPRAAINGDRRGLHFPTVPTTGSAW
jgi:Carboxypeptidase regulatory-like domain